MDDEDPQTEAIEMNHLDTTENLKMADGISNCLVEGLPSGFIVDGELSLNVPIALGESDFENMEEEDEDDEDDANNANDSETSDEKYNQHSVSTIDPSIPVKSIYLSTCTGKTSSTNSIYI